MQWLDGWESLERRSIDWRFAHAPRPERPLDDRIRFVEIDDSAIDSIGRWPWPRSVFADAISELRRAGVKVIALDILFEEHDQVLANDEQLAGEFSKIPVVLATRVGEDESLAEAWSAGAGTPMKELLDRVTSNILADPGVSAQNLAITAEMRNRVLSRPLQFKQLAAWRFLYTLLIEDRLPASFEDFERLVAPDKESRRIGDYPERRILARVWDQFKSWEGLRRFALPGRLSRSSHVVAPLMLLADEAAMTGVVNPQLDEDGRQRQIRPVWPTPVGEMLQFGFAAAAAFEELPLQSIDVAASQISIKARPGGSEGARSWSLDGGRFWIHWPTSGWSWQDSASANAVDRLKRISIGALASLAEMRRKQAEKLDEFRAVTAEVAGLLNLSIPATGDLPAEMLASIRDEAKFQVEAFNEATANQPPSKEELDAVAPYQQWWELETTIARTQADIEYQDKRLANFKESLVFVGWTATGALADFVGTPLGPRTPGVMVHVVVADMVLSGRSVFRPGRLAEAGLLVAMGLLASLLASRLSNWSAPLIVLLLGGYFGLCLWQFSRGTVLMPMVAPMATAAVSWLGATTYIAGMNQRERQRITRQFKARVSSQLVDHLVHNASSVSMAGEQREMTILFADLAGFTSISEKLGGPATVATLNRYMGALTDVLVGHGAYLNKFLGDGLMAFWSAFSPDPDQAARACAAAAECHRAVERLNEDLQKEHGVRLALRVGIATGVVVVGDCGAPPNLNDYTAIGDAVNLAARLESANKQFGTRVLIDARTRDQAASAAAMLLPLGRVVVVGQSTPIEVDAVLVSPIDEVLKRRALTALQAFNAGDRERARAEWLEVERAGQELGALARTYLKALDEATDSFDGVLRLTLK